MAYTVLNLGYLPQAGYEYSATTDSPADWPSVPNSTYFFDFTERQVYYKDSLGGVYGAYVGGATSLNTYNVSSTQWSKTLAAPVSLPTGQLANGFTFFDNVADKIAGGTTSYDEYNIAYGRSIVLNVGNTSGTANINILGVDYPLIWDTNNFTTASNFVAANTATLNALNVRLFALGSGTDGRIRFCSTQAILNAVTITNTSGNLNGILRNEFTGLSAAAGDHVLVPYSGKPYFGKRILHTIRANFNITTGSVQYAELGLYRYQNDTRIGSAILIQRTPDVTGSLVVIETYTSNAADPFVIGGFYLGLDNNTGQTLEFISSAGVLVQNIFDSETSF